MIRHQQSLARRVGVAVGVGALVVVMAGALLATLRGSGTAPIGPTATAVADQGTAHAAMGAVAPAFSVAVSGLQRAATVASAPSLPGGQRYVTLAVRFENRSASQQRATPDDFQLTDSLGASRSPTFLPGAGSPCPRWTMADLYPNGPGSAPPRDAAATKAGRTFGPQPLCFVAGGPADGPLTLIWDPDVSMPLFDSPTRIMLR